MVVQVFFILFEIGKWIMKVVNYFVGNVLKIYCYEDGQIKGMQVFVFKSFFLELKNYIFEEIK